MNESRVTALTTNLMMSTSPLELWMATHTASFALKKPVICSVGAPSAYQSPPVAMMARDLKARWGSNETVVVRVVPNTISCPKTSIWSCRAAGRAGAVVVVGGSGRDGAPPGIPEPVSAGSRGRISKVVIALWVRTRSGRVRRDCESDESGTAEGGGVLRVVMLRRYLA